MDEHGRTNSTSDLGSNMAKDISEIKLTLQQIQLKITLDFRINFDFFNILNQNKNNTFLMQQTLTLKCLRQIPT